MSNNKGNTYSHYTDKRGYHGISNERKIRESTDTINDAAFGKATYTTKLDPSKSTGSQVAKNNYDGAPSYHEGMKKEGRVDYAVRYTDPQSSHQQVDPRLTSGRDVHTHKGDVDLSKMKDVQYFQRTKNDTYKEIKNKNK